MSDVLGYVVVEWHGDDPYGFDRETAFRAARMLRADNPSGRVSVHPVMAEEIEEAT